MTDQPDPARFAVTPVDASVECARTPSTSLARADGWTSDKQARFLQELAATHNVSAAAAAVGMGRQSAYKLRARLRGQPFDRAWEAAYASVRNTLYRAAMERALEGTEVPHYYNGELVGVSRRFDERLTLALLAMQAPRGGAQELARWEKGSHYAAEDLRGLIERVAEGPEAWEADETEAAMDDFYRASGVEEEDEEAGDADDADDADEDDNEPDWPGNKPSDWESDDADDEDDGAAEDEAESDEADDIDEADADRDEADSDAEDGETPVETGEATDPPGGYETRRVSPSITKDELYQPLSGRDWATPLSPSSPALFPLRPFPDTPRR